MNQVITTLVILIVAVVIGTGVVLYGTSLFDMSTNSKSTNEQNKTAHHDEIEINPDLLKVKHKYFFMLDNGNKTTFYVTANDNWTKVISACEVNQWCYYQNNNTLQIINSSMSITGLKNSTTMKWYMTTVKDTGLHKILVDDGKTANQPNFWQDAFGKLYPDTVYQKQVDCSKSTDILNCIKENYPQNYPSELTEATNCQEPCNTSALTYGTEMQMLWGKIQDQNKKILENQNIQMCLEVIKSQYNWDDILKYLTERGVNCTGLEIR